jgi:thiamine pyrophosphate-dependent acetolactate synthase large subunit-like protein
MPTGAAVIVRTLEEAGVEVCFGLPGVHNLALWEALARHIADPAPSVLVARAPALVPPPTTSPRWYRRR